MIGKEDGSTEAQSRGGEEKRRRSVSQLVEDSIVRGFRAWKEKPELWRDRYAFLKEMYRLHYDETASTERHDYPAGTVPAVRTKPTIRKIVMRITDGAGSPFDD